MLRHLVPEVPRRHAKTRLVSSLGAVLLNFALTTAVHAGGLILNEYNAVADFNWLNGGSELSDVDGGLAGDITLGRILGNGGD